MNWVLVKSISLPALETLREIQQISKAGPHTPGCDHGSYCSHHSVRSQLWWQDQAKLTRQDRGALATPLAAIIRELLLYHTLQLHSNISSQFRLGVPFLLSQPLSPDLHLGCVTLSSHLQVFRSKHHTPHALLQHHMHHSALVASYTDKPLPVYPAVVPSATSGPTN